MNHLELRVCDRSQTWKTSFHADHTDSEEHEDHAYQGDFENHADPSDLEDHADHASDLCLQRFVSKPQDMTVTVVEKNEDISNLSKLMAGGNGWILG